MRDLTKIDRPVLDVGVGGNDIFPLSKNNYDVCIDIRKPKIKQENFVLCDASFLPFKDKVFSKCFASDVIEHIDKPLQFLGELRRIADIVQVITPNSQYIGLHLKSLINKNNEYYTHKDHLFIFSKFELRAIFNRAGFKNIIIDYGEFNRKGGKINIGRFIPIIFMKYRALRCIAFS